MDKDNWITVKGRPPEVKDPTCDCCKNNHDLGKLAVGHQCCGGCVAVDPLGGFPICADIYLPIFR